MATSRSGKKRIEVWIDEGDLTEIKRASSRFDLSLSAWVRAAALSAAKAGGATHADAVAELAAGSAAKRQQRSERERARIVADELGAELLTLRAGDGEAGDPSGVDAAAVQRLDSLFFRLLEIVEAHEVEGHVSERSMRHTEAVKSVSYDLRKIGSNVNQIARILNSESRTGMVRDSSGTVVTDADLSAFGDLRKRVENFLDEVEENS